MLIGTEAWAILERLGRSDGLERGQTVPGRALAALVTNGLVEAARGRDGRWARLTRDGEEALAFRIARDGPPRPCARWLAKDGSELFRQLSLVPSELELLRDYQRLPRRADRPDLSEAIAEAFHDVPQRRWLLQVTDDEAAEVARILWLAALSGSVTARNRVARQHSLIHPPHELG